MPELPDIVVYLEALERYVVGQPLQRVRLANPFLLRSVTPPIDAIVGRTVVGVRRIGKRIVLDFGDELFLVIHLMIAGRLRWRPVGGKVPAKLGIAYFDFPNGVLILTEAGTKRRASLTMVEGERALAQVDRGGLEVLDASREAFAERLRRENHTLKRSLTDPRLFSGIGNSYSDEILHRARLSPMQPDVAPRATTRSTRLHLATLAILTEWSDRLRAEVGDGFPETVTAFREGMAVHGRFGQPCPDCGAPVQRIRYADNETNYCARCQNEGRVLADRALSRLLKEDFPRTLPDEE